MNLPAWQGKAIVSRTVPRGERVAQRDGVIKPPKRNPPMQSLVLEVGSCERERERERAGREGEGGERQREGGRERRSLLKPRRAWDSALMLVCCMLS
jgi:hypothetical protein